MEDRKGKPPRLPDRQIAGRQEHVLEMPLPVEPADVTHEKFASPDFSVVSVPGSVHGHADDPAWNFSLGQQGRHVSPVMLDFADPAVGEPIPETPVRVERMHVDGHHVGGEGEKIHEMIDEILFGVKTSGGVEGADIGADQRPVLFEERERPLEQPAEPENRLRRPERHLQGQGNESPAAANEDRPASLPLGHRIIGECPDRPVVRKDGIGDFCQRSEIVGEEDRLIRMIGAGHHQRFSRPLDEQQMQRSVGDHETDAIQPGCWVRSARA